MTEMTSSRSTAELSDLDLLFAARRAARAHDAPAFDPLLWEVARRPSMSRDFIPLVNAMFPPVPHGKYVPVRGARAR